MNQQDFIRRLPRLAGLCRLQDASETQWSVATSVAWLKYLHWVAKCTSEALVARIPSQPIYELKTLLSHHAYLLAEHVNAIRQRVSEMRQPPLGLEEPPHEGLILLFDELEGVPDSNDFVIAVYEVVLPQLGRFVEQLKQKSHPLADAPTRRVAKFFELEMLELLDHAKQIRAAFALRERSSELEAWLDKLRTCFTISAPDAEATQELPVPTYAGQSQHDFVPQRDERFQDPYNAGVNPEAFLYDKRYSSQDKTLMMYYKRLRELDVPEVMASILVELKDEEPWEFYYRMVRQLWDEARHALMGEVGFEALGLDWTAIPINFTWSLNLNTQLTARERHGVLYFIEQGLMPKSGKRFEWEVGMESGDPLSALFQDFDWADEVLHAQIGQRWYVPHFDSMQEALRYGDQCWSKVLSHWQEYREQGLTEHRNWWPELYTKACQKWGKTPDKSALAFDETYCDTRADLKKID